MLFKGGDGLKLTHAVCILETPLVALSRCQKPWRLGRKKPVRAFRAVFSWHFAHARQNIHSMQADLTCLCTGRKRNESMYRLPEARSYMTWLLFPALPAPWLPFLDAVERLLQPFFWTSPDVHINVNVQPVPKA